MASGSKPEALPGEEILRTFKEKMDEFCGIAKSVADMNKTMSSLKADVNELKRKRGEETPENSHSGPKISNQDRSDIAVVTDSESGDESEDENENRKEDDEIDMFLSKDEIEEEEGSFLEVMEQFFSEDSVVGANIDEKLAGLTTNALQQQPKTKDDAKLKEIKERHKRPQNMPWLQSPQIDDFIWRRLHPKVKAADYILQRGHGAMAAALVPITKVLGQVQMSNNKELKQNVGDAFKLLTNAMTQNVHARRERIKRTVHPRYKTTLNKHLPSADRLFGEKLQEEVKALATDCKVNLMAPAGYNEQSQQPFLERRRGLKHRGPNRQNQNNQHQQGYQPHPKKHHGPYKGKNRKFPKNN